MTYTQHVTLGKYKVVEVSIDGSLRLEGARKHKGARECKGMTAMF